jgi:transposase
LPERGETSERLDVMPAQFRVIVEHRPKYACRSCEEAVVQAPALERLIKSGLPTEAMVAHVLVAKYAWPSAALSTSGSTDRGTSSELRSFWRKMQLTSPLSPRFSGAII